MDEKFAENLPWPYHIIPIIFGLFGLISGVRLVEQFGPLARTIFPSICMVIGGFGGLLLIGYISDNLRPYP